MTTLNLGRVRPVWKGDWTSTATYLAFDFVRYTDGNVYLAVQDVPANYIPSSQTAYWVLFGAKGGKGDKGSAGSAGATGSQGPRGVTFTPAVSAEGDLSWTNDGNLSNPGTVNIRGPRGLQGVAGSQGPAGPTGPAGTTNYNNLTNKPVSDTSLKLAKHLINVLELQDKPSRTMRKLLPARISKQWLKQKPCSWMSKPSVLPTKNRFTPTWD